VRVQLQGKTEGIPDVSGKFRIYMYKRHGVRGFEDAIPPGP